MGTPRRRRAANSAGTTANNDVRKKIKKTSEKESMTTYVLKEIRDFFLLIGAVIICALIYSICSVYFYSGEDLDLKRFYPVNGPELTPCDSCTRETVGPLSVITAGNRDGQMLIFLHGFPETAYLTWHSQIDYFSRMGYFVVAPDQRGYNTSAKFDSIMDYHLDYLAQDVVDLIDHYGREKASVVGHDWGAAVAWHLGQYHEDRLDKLVIINVPHPLVMRNTLTSSWTQLKMSWYIFWFQLPYLPESKIHRNDFKWLSGAFSSSPPGTISRSTLEMYHEAWGQPGAASGMVNWYRAAILGNLIRRSTPKRVENTPTLVIWGDQDFALSTSMAKPSVDMCDHGKLVTLEGVTHWVTHEAPAKVNALVSDFLI